MKTTEAKAALILREIEPVKHISVFGERLLSSGVIRPSDPGKRHTRQGLALLAGRWLRRMERCGMAREGMHGWVTTNQASGNHFKDKESV